MPFTTRFWRSTAVLLCALLVQSCQPNSVSATAEEELAASLSSSASAVCQRALGEPQAVGSLALFKEDHATLPSARELVLSVTSPHAGTSNPSVAPHHLLATERLGFHALGNTPGDVFSSVFTASSGECVRFRQHNGQWCAVLAPGTSLNGQEDTLPVVSSGNIGALLSSLQGQDAWSSRSRIHVLATPTAPYSTCVYVGKVGLLGGAPAQRAQEPAEEWLQGPTMILGSNVKSKKGTYHIPPGYRYKACRLKAGSVVQRASLTIDYVAAENEEEYRRLEAAQNAHAAAAGVGINVGQVVTLGEIKSNVGHAAFVGHEGHDLKRTKHAGLVLYGSTKKNKVFPLGDPKNKSMINIQVEILVERVGETPLVNPHGSYATGGINHGDTKPPAQDAPSPPQEREAELAHTVIPTMAFGVQEWSRYYGEVGASPRLPADIEATLDAPCPFWKSEGKKVRDTHLLVLIPAEVAGKPFTLNLLGELIKSPKGGGSKTEYRYYGNDVQSQVGDEAPAGSYWILLTRDVLPESRSETYTAQKALVAGHASRTGLSYEPPKILEAATAILTHHVRTGERLYSDAPWTYTRCQELIHDDSDYPSVVGGFESSGLRVDDRTDDNYDDYVLGVAGCRKF